MSDWMDWRDETLERDITGAVSLDAPWALVERFAGLVRESGTEEEAAAVAEITARLDEWGIPYQLHHPVCWISLPRESALQVYGEQARTVAAKTPAMAVATGDEPVRGELVYVPSGYARGVGDLFASNLQTAGAALAGKIALTEGLPMPGKVAELTRLGARAAVFVSPGERIHEGICTTIWGAPDLDSVERQPTLPVIEVNHSDGLRLIEEARAGTPAPPRPGLGQASGVLGVEVGVVARLETRWRPIPVLVAEIRGNVEPDHFVLFHGHLDSWHGGVGDNATGDATLLELARVFHQHRHRLARTLRVAWWSGHSHGRYAGSTWYADAHALDLVENCIAQVDCDSPGCRWATTFDNLTMMSEAHACTSAAIFDTTGIAPTPDRPPRAGDYSFNNIGITATMMLSSTMSPETRQEHGYYAVGGCGGNIAWHTEDDTLEIADRDNLLRDMRVYAALLCRILNAPLHPFDFTATADEFMSTLQRYGAAAGAACDLAPALSEAQLLRDGLREYYAAVPALQVRSPADPAVQQFNATTRVLGRLLIPLNYSRAGIFRQDPALDVPPLPDLAPALALADEPADSGRARVIATHLLRGRNRFIWT
ncbi:MAG TPA: M28 family metallopeptidase, partial [Thermomicrobiales bacterium]|nr:M28 family metallopeptidase [Thermomicrobiales bacterium]